MFRKPILASSALILLLSLSGCPKAPATTAPTDTVDKAAWPPAPLEPIVRFEEAIVTSAWSHRPSFLARLARALVGQSKEEKLSKPYGVATDSRGRVFVTDPKGLAIFDRAENKFQFFGRDAGDGRLGMPLAITVDSRDHIFIADVEADRVVELDPDLRFVHAYGGEHLKKPGGVAVHEQRKELWVVDSKSEALQVYALGGEHLRTVGERGGLDGQFRIPVGIEISGDEVYVVDTMNFRVQVLDGDGNFLRKWGENCLKPGCFARPKGIGIDSEGNVHVVDSAFQNVQVFTSDGRLALMWGRPEGPDRIVLPADLHIDSDDRIYVVGQYSYSVALFRFLGSPANVDSEDEPEPPAQ